MVSQVRSAASEACEDHGDEHSTAVELIKVAIKGRRKNHSKMNKDRKVVEARPADIACAIVNRQKWLNLQAEDAANEGRDNLTFASQEMMRELENIEAEIKNSDDVKSGKALERLEIVDDEDRMDDLG
jgi:hypothetical protein